MSTSINKKNRATASDRHTQHSALRTTTSERAPDIMEGAQLFDSPGLTALLQSFIDDNGTLGPDNQDPRGFLDLDVSITDLLGSRDPEVTVPDSDTSLPAWIARKLNAKDPQFFVPFFLETREELEKLFPESLSLLHSFRIGDAPPDLTNDIFFTDLCKKVNNLHPRAAITFMAIPTYGRFIANAYLSYVHDSEFMSHVKVSEHPYDSRKECVFSRNTVGGGRTGNIFPLLYSCCESCKSRLVAGDEINLDPAVTPKFAYPKLLRSFGYDPARMTLKFLDVKYKVSDRPRKEPIKVIEVEMDDGKLFYMKTGPKDIDHNAGSYNVNLTLTPLGRKLKDPIRNHVVYDDAEVYVCPCNKARTAYTYQTMNNVPDVSSMCPICHSEFPDALFEDTVCKTCSDASTLYLNLARDKGLLVFPNGIVDIFLDNMVVDTAIKSVPDGFVKDVSGLPVDEAVLKLRAERTFTTLLMRNTAAKEEIELATRRRKRRNLYSLSGESES